MIAQIYEYEYKNSNEDIILQFVKENEGSTKTKVINFMFTKKYASAVTAHKTIIDLVNEKKLICKMDKSNSRIHHLFFNDKNQYNQIRKQLSELELFIKEKNEYLRALLDDNLKRIGDLGDNQDEDEQKDFTQQTDFFKNIESIYVVDTNRMLDDLFHVVVTSKISEKDKQLFSVRIIELKSKLVFYVWNVTDEKKFFDMLLGNIRNYMRIVESQSAVQNYIEEKKVYAELIEPLKTRIENFKQVLSN